MCENQVMNKRSFYRVCLEKPICADFKIVECNGRSLSTRLIKACIIDIGPGGLAFATKLSLPTDKNLTFQFNITIDNINIYFRGQIVWRREVGKKTIYNYGVIFNMNETERTEAIKLFNKLSIYIKRGNGHKYCSICDKDIFPCT